MTVEWGHRGASVAMTSPSTIAAKLEEPWSVGCSAGRSGWVIMAVMIRGVSREEVPAMGLFRVQMDVRLSAPERATAVEPPC